MLSGARTAFVRGAGVRANVQSASRSDLHLPFVSKASRMIIALVLKGIILNNIPVILIFISSRKPNKCSDQRGYCTMLTAVNLFLLKRQLQLYYLKLQCSAQFGKKKARALVNGCQYGRCSRVPDREASCGPCAFRFKLMLATAKL